MKRFFLKIIGRWTPSEEKQWRRASLSAEKWFATASFEELKEHFMEILGDGVTDERYREIYGDRTEAIKEAKNSWRRAGIEVCYSTLMRTGNGTAWAAFGAAREETK